MREVGVVVVLGVGLFCFLAMIACPTQCPWWALAGLGTLAFMSPLLALVMVYAKDRQR